MKLLHRRAPQRPRPKRRGLPQFRVRPNDPVDTRTYRERLEDERRLAAAGAVARAVHLAGTP